MSFQSTPPMRGATCTSLFTFKKRIISIHAPHAGSDTGSSPIYCRPQHFNPRPPCGERPASGWSTHMTATFQSTPPMRGAREPMEAFTDPKVFQSTPPMRGATAAQLQLAGLNLFQSTPPMRGATSRARPHGQQEGNFNPRPPCGERPATGIESGRAPVFQSTPPMRGASRLRTGRAFPEYFNPRPPCGERPFFCSLP